MPKPAPVPANLRTNSGPRRDRQPKGWIVNGVRIPA